MSQDTPDDTFELYDLKVTVEGEHFVCRHHVGQGFLVEGEDLVFPEGGRFSMYALAAILPLLPAKERPTHAHDWMTTDAVIACPDPHCGAKFRITRTKKRILSHAACTVVPLDAAEAKAGTQTDDEGSATPSKKK